jgi:LemA protein
MVYAILGLIVLAVVILVGMYNSLVRLKVQTDNAWADIDVQLKRRYDLIPNLVETVKGYAAHEKGTLEAVINARNRAMTATAPADKAQAENMLWRLKVSSLSPKHTRSFAPSRSSPRSEIPHRNRRQPQNARRYYNAVVRDLNTKSSSSPPTSSPIHAGFKPREFSKSPHRRTRSPKVSFNAPRRPPPSRCAWFCAT